MGVEIPASGFLGNAARTNAEFQTGINQLRDYTSQLAGGPKGATLTIASGVITPTSPWHEIDTQGAAPTDDLTHIDNGDSMPEGSVLLLSLVSASRVVTLKNKSGGTGEIYLADDEDFVHSETTGGILLRKRGTAWYEDSRAGAGSDKPHGYILLQSTGGSTWTVPPGVQSILRTMAGAGGGGGGGSDGASDGGAGSAGVGSTDFGVSSFSVGSPGGGGKKEGGGGKGGRLLVASPSGFISGSNGTTSDGTNDAPGGPRQHAHPNTLGGFGGNGGDGDGGGGGGGGGQAGNMGYRTQESVTPGQVIAYQTGVGGAAGTHLGPVFPSGLGSRAGGDGFIIIEW